MHKCLSVGVLAFAALFGACTHVHAQYGPPVCNVSNAQVNGYVLTATSTGGHLCAWQVGGGGGGGAVSSVFGRTGAVVANTGDYTVSQVTGAAPLASPSFTGSPTGPTATFGTNTTQLATTAFVQAAIGAGCVIATTSILGCVKPDGTTITISGGGVITAHLSGGAISGTLTSGKIPVATGTSTVGDSGLSDDGTELFSLAEPMQFYRATSSTVYQPLKFCIGSPTCSQVALGDWDLGFDAGNNMQIRAGNGSSAANALTISPLGNVIAANNLQANTVTATNHFVVNGVTFINNTQDLVGIHSYTSTTGNFQISGDNILLNRSTCSTVQQIQWMVGSSLAVNGSYTLGNDGSCNFSLFSGLLGSSALTVTPSGALTTPSSVQSGSITATGTLRFNTQLSANGLAVMDNGGNATLTTIRIGSTPIADTSGNLVVGSGGNAINAYRASSASASAPIQLCVGTYPTCNPNLLGGWVAGTDSSADFTFSSGTGSGLLLAASLSSSGTLTLSSNLSAGNGNFSGTLTANNHLVVNAQTVIDNSHNFIGNGLTLTGLSSGSGTPLCITSNVVNTCSGGGGGATAPLVLGSNTFTGNNALFVQGAGAFNNVNDYSPIVGLLGPGTTTTQTLTNYFHVYQAGHVVGTREGAGEFGVLNPSGSTNWEGDGVIAMAVNLNTPVYNPAFGGFYQGGTVVAVSGFAASTATNNTGNPGDGRPAVFGANFLVQDYADASPTVHHPSILIGMEIDTHSNDTNDAVSGININTQHPNGHPTGGSFGVHIQQALSSWFDYAFQSDDFAAQTGMVLGRQPTSFSTTQSQHLQFLSVASSPLFTHVYAQNGGFVIAPDVGHTGNTLTLDNLANMTLSGSANVASLTSGPVIVNDPTANQGVQVVSGSGASALRLWTTDSNASNRNWDILNRYSAFGVLELRVSNSQFGDPTTAGTTAAFWDSSGNMTENQGLTVTTFLSVAGATSTNGLVSTGGITASGNITSLSLFNCGSGCSGGYEVFGTQVIDPSRNLLNITTASITGTLSVGSSITATGNLVAAGVSSSNNISTSGGVAKFVNQGNVGVTCSGAPTGSFATSGGIVTHC